MATNPALERVARLNRLKLAVTEYVAKEKLRIDTEVRMLKAVARGRRAGEAAGMLPILLVRKAAEKDLEEFLRVE